MHVCLRHKPHQQVNNLLFTDKCWPGWNWNRWSYTSRTVRGWPSYMWKSFCLWSAADSLWTDQIMFLIRPEEKCETTSEFYLDTRHLRHLTDGSNSLSVQSFSRASVILNLSKPPWPGDFPATFRLSVVPRPWSMIVSNTVRLFLNRFPKGSEF